MVTTQSIFLLREIGKNVGDEHLSRFLAFLISIFKELNPQYFKENEKGRKREYPLQELLGLHYWGDINNKVSCREKEEMCDGTDEKVKMLISGTPKKSKINDFKNIHNELIKEFDRFIVEFCQVMGMVEATEFVGDGTFLDGNCNDFKALYPDEIEYIKKFLTQQEKHKKDYTLLYNHYYLNEESNEEFIAVKKQLKRNINVNGINLIIKALENNDAYQEVLVKLEHMSENITKENVKVSIVDPDAHYMKDKDNNWGFHYNLQEIIDPKYGIVVDHYVTKNPNDAREIKKIITRLIDQFGHEGFIGSFDNGYFNIKLLKEIINETLVELAIPDTETASATKENIKNKNYSDERYEKYLEEKKKNSKHRTFIDIGDFIYHDDNDAFECPVMHYFLDFQRTKRNSKDIEYREYWTNKCKTCPHHDECTSQDKRVIRKINEPEIIHIKEFYESTQGQEAYSKRAPYAEGSFAIQLAVRNFRRIKVRGEDNVDLELTRFITQHNILKIFANVDIIVLKKVLRYIKNQKKTRRATMDMLWELQGNFIVKDGKIIDVLI